ncbi:hypothetical protein [Pseudarthrobacter sp. NPDC080039]|uniref:hypothetical protein n=1 Tax=unclassified Pseudarthrobacter TaxID=2647000 RepID=UPI00344FB6A4
MDFAAIVSFLAPLLPIATVAALIWSAWNTVLGFRRADAREHLRWLQEKRREAYVNFLAATRKASRSISAPHRRAKLKERAAAIFADEEEVSYALDVVVIVGPPKMARMAREVEARLKMDRVFYSPKRGEQMLPWKEKYIQRAQQTGEPVFAHRFARLYDAERFDMAAYEELHAEFPLRDFWRDFSLEAEKELARDRPEGRLRRWLNSRSAKDNASR